MAATVEELQIEINAKAQSANTAIDRLVEKLDVLSNSIGKLNISNFSGFSVGVKNLSSAMQGLKDVKLPDYKSLAKGIERLSTLDSGTIMQAGTAIGELGRSLRVLDNVNVSDNAKQIVELASGIKQLGYGSATKAVENIPLLAKEMKNLMATLSGAPKVSQNLIDMTNALANLSRTGASSGRAASSVAKSLDAYTASTSRASKGSFSLASAIGKLYATYWLLFRAFRGLGEAINISADLTEVQNVVNVTFGEYKSLVEEMSKTSIVDFGMSELTVKQVASRFQAMGSAMGFAQGEMADMSIELTKLTADMASFYNVEQDAVAEDLAAIFTGETRPLRTYGLDLTQATLQEWALKQGMDANIQSMSQMEKATLRYQYVLANTGAAQGDFAKTAGTWSNQVRILKQQFQQLGAVVGGTLINALKPLVKALNSVMGHIIAFAETVSNALGKIFGWKFEVGGGGVTNDLETGAGAADEIAGGMNDAAKAAKKLRDYTLGIDELNIISPDTGDSGSGGSGGGSGAGGGGGASGGQWTQTESIFEEFESEIDTLYKLGNYIRDALIGAMESIQWESVYEKARNFGTGLAEFLNGLFAGNNGKTLFGEVGKTIAGALNTAIYGALSLGEEFNFEQFGYNIADGINNFFANFDFASLAKTLNVWADGVYKTIKSAIANIKWGEVFSGIFDFFSNLEFDTLLLGIIPSANKLWKSLSGGKAVKVIDLFTKFKNLFKGNFFGNLNTAIGGVRDSLNGLQKGFIGITSVLGEFSMVEDAFYDISMGADNLGTSILQIVTSAGTASAALYTAFGPAGLAAGAIAGLIGAFSGLSKAAEEQQQIALFGDTLDNLTSKTNSLSEAILGKMNASREYVETAGVAEMTLASDLADRYFDLADKEGQTNEEKAEMQRLAGLLIEQLPQLREYYNAETGLINGTREAVARLIEARLREIQVEAAEEKLLEAYQAKYDAMEGIEEISGRVKTAQEEMNRLNQEYQDILAKMDVLTQYENLSTQILNATGDTESLLTKQEELWNQLTSSGEESFPSFTYLQEQLGNASQAIYDFQDEYNTIMGEGLLREDAIASAQSNIDYYTGIVTSGMSQAASDAATGFSSTMASDTSMQDASFQQMQEILSSVRGALGEHSPSKEFQQIADYAVQGFVIGIENGSQDAVNSVNKLADDILQAFSERLGSNTEGSMFSGMFTSLKNTWSEIDNWWSAAVQTWFTDKVQPWFDIEKWTEMYANIKTAFGNVWDDTVRWWDSSILRWYNDSVKAMFTVDKWMFPGIKDGLTKSFEAATQAAKAVWNNFARNMTNNLKMTIDPIVIDGQTIFKGQTISLGRFPTFYNGGFPDSASLFWAGEHGVPEIVGTVGGRTAVASGAEITGIADAVYDTGQTEAALLQTAVGLLQIIADKEFGVELDGRELVSAIDQRRARNGYSFSPT